MPEVIAAIRELNEHPSTVFTVLTGEGRFFSAGADVRGRNLTESPKTRRKADDMHTGSGLEASPQFANAAEKKLSFLTRFAPGKLFANTIWEFNRTYS